MARDSMSRGPNVIHPEKPSAVGSRNSLNRDNRNEYEESKLIIDEEVDKVLNHIHAKLPPEVLEKVDIMGGVKSKLHNYFNQNFQNMYNRYMVTMEDEMAKKVRDLVDKEEYRALNRYTPREIAEILDKIGGMDKFNTGEVEKSIVNIYGHLQGHIQRGVYELENETNALLRQKQDVGAFVRGENAYAIAKCSFKNNFFKPKTVMDVKLAINIQDTELISPIYHYEVPIETIIKDIISKHVHEMVDQEIKEINMTLLDEGKEELTDSEMMFEKIKALENYVDDDTTNEQSKRYQFVAKRFMDKITGLTAEIDPDDYDPLNVRENIKRIIDNENIRNRGFNTILNSITAILDTSKMGYQHVENFKNAREAVIREYEDQDLHNLPDERYQIRVTYYDDEQIRHMRNAYDLQFEELKKEFMKVVDVTDVLYQDDKAAKNQQDWSDVSAHYLEKDKPGRGWFGSRLEEEEEEEEEQPRLWNEVTFIPPRTTEAEEANKTNLHIVDELRKRMVHTRAVMTKVYKNQHPVERTLVEGRLQFLEEKFETFETNVNPYHILPGVLLEVDITSVKRKKTTMMAMANVLNEFLYSVSKGFHDTAFADFSRRRSTVREDLDQTFESVVD
ncbi:MAG: cytoplasmic filament protein CfpA [SAR324 cluster bacterium]|nr:cytoplasmic filament protein CfpA [SAR324 cluster bacterium]MCZ6627011.1 cytoplasmic filament protein CfpA [SAR324 cluster bacterium]MCZ6730593.1 cytoplasmic filament protein CfpA [SAR324 cluster bacterium]